MIIEAAALFILLSCFAIGWRVSESVPDETVPAKTYLKYGAALCITSVAAIIIYNHSSGLFGLLIGALSLVALVVARWHGWIAAALCGGLCALALLSPAYVQGQVAVLAILANYLLGTTAKKEELPSFVISFLCAALAVAVA